MLQSGVERNLILPGNPDLLLMLTTPRPELLEGGMTHESSEGKQRRRSKNRIHSVNLSEREINGMHLPQVRYTAPHQASVDRPGNPT